MNLTADNHDASLVAEEGEPENSEALSALSLEFSTLPPDYQNVLRLAQERYGIQIRPLQALKGGRTAARLYLVSVCEPVRHLVLKLDRVNPLTDNDEWTRHRLAANLAPTEFVRQHMAGLAYDLVAADGALALFYTIAGQSLTDFRPAASYERKQQLTAIFGVTNEVLLNKWNRAAAFEQVVHPQKLLLRWLGYRIGPEGHIGPFLEEVCHIRADTPGLLIQGNIYPNPLAYARNLELWHGARAIDIIAGFQHGDLNLGNILVKFAENDPRPEGYYLIDFSLFQAERPLFYDQTYLEMAYLLRELARMPIADWVAWVTCLAEQDVPDQDQAPVALAGACSVVAAGRRAFNRWLKATHPSLYDDLWAQYRLAAVAAGLNYCNKPLMPVQERLAGLIFAAVHLKRACSQFGARQPAEIAHLGISSLQASAALSPARSLPLPPSGAHNLPLPPTPLIGREREVKGVRDALLHDDVRLLTLTGAGGTGKTRLALEVAAQLPGNFGHGVFFVSLAEISEPQLVLAKIAQALDVREGGMQALLETVKAYLRGRQLLLLLDNFEHVLGAAPLIAELLATAPRLKVLVTSRALLNLPGEHSFPVPALALPNQLERLTLDGLREVEAIRLFVERARAVNAHFALTEENAAAVAEICRRLDGLPLALELAAARARHLTAEEIAARLDDRFRLLVDGSRAALLRQQTLRALIDWSHDLLADGERALFRRLSLFAGGWTLAAAEAVAAGRGIEAGNVLDLLAVLVDQSLVLVAPAQGRNRYWMLETLQQYAQARLEESSEREVFAQRHAEYFMKMAAEAYGALWGAEQGQWLDRLETEHDNLRAALAWMARDAERAEMLLQLAGTLWRFWDVRGYISEGRSWLEQALALNTDSSTYLRANGLRGAGMLARRQGDFARARAMHEQSLALFQELGFTVSAARALDALGEIAQAQGDFGRALELHRESLRLRFENDDEEGIAISLAQLGRIARARGRYQLAEDLLAESVELHRKRGDQLDAAFSLNNLGLVASLLCEYERAIALFEEALAIYRALNDKIGISDALQNLGNVAKDRGHMQEAKTIYEECLSLKEALGNRRGIARVLSELAEVALCQGEYARAEELAGRSLALFRELDARAGIMIGTLAQAFVSHYWGAHDRASSLARTALALATDLGMPRGVAYARAALGLEAYAEGQLQEAEGEFQQALAGFREVDDRRNVAYTMVNLARTLYRKGDYPGASRLLEESLSISRELDIRWSLAYALEIMGLLQRSQGNSGTALELFQESLHLSYGQGNRQGIANCLGALAGIAGTTGQPIQAARLFAAADRLRKATGVGLAEIDRQEMEHYLAPVRDQLDSSTIASAWSAGYELTIEQAIAEASRLE